METDNSNPSQRSSKASGIKEVRKPLFSSHYTPKIALYVGFSLLLVLICFVGQFPFSLEVLPNQTAKIRIVADYAYSYTSDLITERKQEQLRQKIAPVYRIEKAPFERFTTIIDTLTEELTTLESSLQNLPEDQAKINIQNFTNTFNEEYQFLVNADDIAFILQNTTPLKRAQVIKEGLTIMRDITGNGIWEPLSGENNNQPYFFTIEIEGRQSNAAITTEKDALRSLSLNLVALDIEWPVARAFFRILRSGIQPNLIFDTMKTEAKMNAAIASMEPVTVTVPSGQTIIEPGSVIGPEQIEQLRAYRKFLKENEDLGFGFNVTLRERTILTLVILLAAVLYVKVGIPELLKSNRKISLCLLITALNLLIIRLILEVGNMDALAGITNLLSILPFICPVALGPIITTILIGPRPAIVTSALIATFYALMLGSVTSFLLIALIASLVGIYFCRSIRLRNHVVRAGAFTGIVTAFAPSSRAPSMKFHLIPYP